MVKEIPFIVIEPFCTKYFLYFLGNLKLINHDFPIICIFLTSAVAST